MQDELRIEKEYKQLAENLLLESYEQKVRDGKAGESKIGERLANYSFSTVKGNIQTLFEFENTHGGVVPAYQDTINQLLTIYKDDKENLYILLTMCTFNVLTSHALKDKEYGTPISAIAESLFYNIYEEVKAYEFLRYYCKDENKKYANWYVKELKQRQEASYKHHFAEAFYKNREWISSKFNTEKGKKLACKLIELCTQGSGYFEYCLVEKLNNKKKGTQNTISGIKPKQWLLDTWVKNVDLLQVNTYKLCPMIIKPRDWDNPEYGGYYGDLAKYAQFIRIDFLQSNSFIKDYQKRLKQLDLSWICRCQVKL